MLQCNSWCYEECAGTTKSRDLCVEAVIKPLKTSLKELAVLQDSLLKWPKFHFVLNLKFEQNIALLFSFTLRNSFLRELLVELKLNSPHPSFSFCSNIDLKI
jgi:hypothetical protein